MGGRAVRELFALPVRFNGIRLGRPVDILFDREADRLVGFDVLCGDDVRRFLPFAVAEIRADEIAISSALLLLDEPGLTYYRRRTRQLGELELVDPRVDDQGHLHEAVTAV
jgi:hypothetical protein